MTTHSAEAARYYSEHSTELLDKYESVTFEMVHAGFLPHLREVPGAALDVGAGSGRDAAWLAARGWAVVAAEPSKPLREGGRRLHSGSRIQWIDDALPDLHRVRKLNRRFDLILLSAVWMHISPASEQAALAALAELCAPGAVLVISIRTGGNNGKRGFHTPDITQLKQASTRMGFSIISEGTSRDRFGRSHIAWKDIILRY